MAEEDVVARSDALDARIADAAGMNKRMADLMAASRRNSMLIKILAASVAFDVLLSAAVIYQEVVLGGVTTRLDATVTVQRQRALCPLYQVFLDSRNARSRAASPDPAKYDAAYRVIQDGYDILKCSEFIKTP